MSKDTTLIFTGDIGFDKYMDKRWDDKSLLDNSIYEFLESGNHRIVNVEGPLYEVKKDENASGAKALVHAMDPSAVSFLNRINADVWNICNNHIMDAKAEGIESTIKIAKENGAATLGAGMNIDMAASPVIFNEAGGVGMIGVGYQRACRKADNDTPGCFSWSDMDRIKDAIKAIKQKCRWCIVVAHGGEEFTSLPSPYTRERYIEYLNMGADIVVSHHPHVPMNYETFDNKAIFYSLGNFVFDTDYQRAQFNTELGIILKLKLNENDYSFEAMGLKLDRENGVIKQDLLPDIFEDVQKEEYDKLIALSSKAFIENTKKQLKYLRPKDFENASDEDFVKNFYEPLRSGRVPGEVLDMQIVYPLSLKADENDWENSKLTKVKDYILRQIP